MGKKVETIGIVDDDGVYRFTTEKYIQMLNLPVRVLHFKDAEEAFLYLKDNAQNAHNIPDILFLDLNMPIMDGWDFLQEYEGLKPEIAKEVRIYLVSSSTDDRDYDRSKEFASVSGYITKPISEKHLEELLTQ